MGAVGQVVPLYASLTNEPTVHRAVDGADLVVNTVGILAEQRAGDFQRIHAEGVGLVARLAAAAGVARLVHISAIGADPDAASRYAATKGIGEALLREAFPAATILRPSLVFGPEDAPVQPLRRNGAPDADHAGDLRRYPVPAGLCRRRGRCGDGRIGPGGRRRHDLRTRRPACLAFRELLAYILKETGRKRRMVDMPMGLARLQARIMELVPGKPLTRDQLLMLQQDNVVAADMPGLQELGVVPTPVELVVPTYLRRFRPGGGTRRVLPRSRSAARRDLS